MQSTWKSVSFDKDPWWIGFFWEKDHADWGSLRSLHEPCLTWRIHKCVTRNTAHGVSVWHDSTYAHIYRLAVEECQPRVLLGIFALECKTYFGTRRASLRVCVCFDLFSLFCWALQDTGKTGRGSNRVVACDELLSCSRGRVPWARRHHQPELNWPSDTV